MNKVCLFSLLLLVTACSTPRMEAKKVCQRDAHVILLDTAAPGVTSKLLDKQEEAKYQACMTTQGF